MILGAVAVTAAVALAAAVQAISGSGFGLVAAPLLLVVAPGLVPGPLLLVTPLLMGLALGQDRAGLRAPGRPVPDLAVASLLGAAGALAALPVVPLVATGWLRPAVGAGVVAIAGAGLLGLALPGSPRSLAVAGAAGGVLSTIAAMPGPPVAVTYRASDPVRLRANLALYFLTTCTCSVAVLGVGGELGVADLRGAALLLPGLVAGLALGVVVRRRLPHGWAQPMGLWLAAGSGAALLAGSLAG